MDMNNYNYTPHLLDEQENVIANYQNENGYGKITIEQWGTDKNKKMLCLHISDLGLGIDIDTAEPYLVDDCQSRKVYENTVKIFNKYSPEPIPLF